MVRVENAEPLMHLFSTTLGLPISWPLQRKEFATYGWVTVGNVNLEFWEASDNSDLPHEQALPIFHGFALTPIDINKSVAILAERGINTKPPRPYVTMSNDGRQVTNFTNAVITDLSTNVCCIFLCEWGDEGTIFPWAEKLTPDERRLKEQRLLSAYAGGLIGVTGLVEVRMTTPNTNEYEMKWRNVSGHALPIDLGNGVTLALTRGNETIVESIVLGVRSLDEARRFLARNQLLGEDLGDEISLSEEACFGLRFHFRQRDAV